MYPKHVGHENGGCGHLGRAPLSPPTFGGHSCKKDCMVAPHESRLVYGICTCIYLYHVRNHSAARAGSAGLRSGDGLRGRPLRPASCGEELAGAAAVQRVRPPGSGRWRAPRRV
jgi:hypothetical protein